MIQKAECKSSDASSSWQTMLRGCLTVHAFLFFEPLPSAPVQHKHTHGVQRTHAGSGRDEPALTFFTDGCVYDYLFILSYPFTHLSSVL